MATADLEVNARPKGTKAALNTLREQGQVPGVVYGKAVGSLPISIDGGQLQGVINRHGSSALVELKVKSGARPKKYHAIIKEVQYHPFKQQIQHIDLQQISLKEEVNTHVPLHYAGAPVGVKQGGLLEHHLRQVEVTCLPASIPERIEVDISGLDIGDSIHVKDLVAPEGVRIATDGAVVVAAVSAPRREAEPEPEQGGEAPAAAVQRDVEEARAKPEEV